MTHDWPQMTRRLAAALKDARIGAQDLVEPLATIAATADAVAEMDAPRAHWWHWASRLPSVRMAG